MNVYKITVVFLGLFLINSSVFSAQKLISSGKKTAGFRFVSESVVQNGAVKPIISYQQDIQMLSATGDMPSVKVFGNGYVLVHLPLYLKKAGDYEMTLSEAELKALLRSMAGKKMFDFNKAAIDLNKKNYKKKLKNKGQYFEISDSLVTTIDLQFDEYQKNSSSPVIKNYRKNIRWKDIDHDMKRFSSNPDITNFHDSVLMLKELMKHPRLLKKGIAN